MFQRILPSSNCCFKKLISPWSPETLKRPGSSTEIIKLLQKAYFM